MVAKTPFRAAVLLIATSLAGAATAPAQAQSNQSPVTVLGHPEALTRIVPFGDLALATTAGQRLLVHRVSNAVREVCPDSAYAYTIYNFTYDDLDCANFAWAGARPQIRQAINAAKSGQPFAMSIAITGAGR